MCKNVIHCGMDCTHCMFRLLFIRYYLFCNEICRYYRLVRIAATNALWYVYFIEADIMDRIKAYRLKSIRYIIALSILGITLLYTFYSINKIKPDYLQIIPVLLIASWLVMYIDYVNLKTKIEILRELDKERPTASESE